jgi:pterin-4a-carbinolamine dehydratase
MWVPRDITSADFIGKVQERAESASRAHHPDRALRHK